MDESSSLSANIGVSFSVDFDDQAKTPTRKPPKNLTGDRYRKKDISRASLDEKQKLADERRKKHIGDRLERIRQLEEEAMKLAQAMDPIIQASTQANRGKQMESNGINLPNSVRPRCAENDLVKAARDFVASSTDPVLSEIDSIGDC